MGKRQHCNCTAGHRPSGKGICGYAIKGRRIACTKSRACGSQTVISYIWRTCNLSIFTTIFGQKVREEGLLVVWMLPPHIPMSFCRWAPTTLPRLKALLICTFIFVCVGHSSAFFLAFCCTSWALVIAKGKGYPLRVPAPAPETHVLFADQIC